MISLDQVLLLQQKVESAVAKIAELNQTVAQKEAENAALRSKCVELTNALSAKTEQFSSFQSDQSKIEEGILKALERLNAVESTVLSVATAAVQASAQAPAQPTPAKPERKLFANESPAKPTADSALRVAQPAGAISTGAAQAYTNEEPEPPISPDMTLEQAMQPTEANNLQQNNAAAPEESEPAANPSFEDSGSIDPDITFDDASPSPDQPDAAQAQFDIF